MQKYEGYIIKLIKLADLLMTPFLFEGNGNRITVQKIEKTLIQL